MSDLTPELAGKVLAANLRNIVKKIGDGGTLTTAENELMEKALLDGQLSPELHRARRAALIRRWTSGHRLNSDEQAEIASVIPATHVMVKRVTSEKYKLKLADYAALLVAAGMENKKDNVRKLKYWIKAGRTNKDGTPREEPDFPPFDELDQLAEWWKRNMTYKAPDFMIELAKAAAEAPAKQPPATNGKEPAKSNGMKPPSDDMFADYGEIKLDDDVANDLGVRVSYSLVVDDLKRFEAARKDQNGRLMREIRKELREDLAALRQDQVAALKVLEGKGDYLRTRVLLEDANRVFSVMRISFMNSMEAVIEWAAPTMPYEERHEQALTQSDKIFEHLQATRFAEAWQPSVES